MKIRALHDEFHADQPAAEKKYLGKLLRAERISLSTGASRRYGTPVIEVSDIANGTRIATFVLPYDERLTESFRLLKSITLGSTIVVSGECRLYDKHDDYIVFKQCEVLDE